MGRVEELRRSYAAVREDADNLAFEYVREHAREWASGATAMEYFGGEANALDALCLMAIYERQLRLVLDEQVADAHAEGHSWNEVAAALGVSRQAATKRFG